MSEMICYCFGYTDDDIKNDIKLNRRSTIMERIAAEKKAGKCRCQKTNPKGK